MSTEQHRQPTLDTIVPHMLVEDMEQALAFYEQLGFATTSHHEGSAIIERDGVSLHFTVFDPTQEPSEGCRVCYIGVTNIEGLYQQYVPTGAIRSSLPLRATDWGTKGFWLCDPSRDILIFEENIPKEECDTEQAAWVHKQWKQSHREKHWQRFPCWAGN